MAEILEVQTRRSIFEAIQSNPGLHLREIARRLGLKASLVEYHVRELSVNDLIVESKEEGYRRFYPSEDPSAGRTGFSSKHRKALHLLRQDVPLRIALLLLDKGGCTHKELLSCLDVSGSTLSYHLTKMTSAKMVCRYRDEWGKGFRLEDPKEVLWLLMRGGLRPSVVDGMMTTFDDFY